MNEELRIDNKAIEELQNIINTKYNLKSGEIIIFELVSVELSRESNQFFHNYTISASKDGYKVGTIIRTIPNYQWRKTEIIVKELTRRFGDLAEYLLEEIKKGEAEEEQEPVDLFTIKHPVERAEKMIELAGIMKDEDLTEDESIDQDQEQFYVTFEILKYLEKHYHITKKDIK